MVRKATKNGLCSIKVLCVTFVCMVLVLIAIVLLALIGIPRIINGRIAKDVRLENGTLQWDRFLEIPFALHLKFYLFNVTNADEIMQGEKPKLVELGPYHYTQYRKKEILSTDPHEDTVTFEQYMNITFNKELSGDFDEEDEVIMLNPIMQSMTQITTTIERMVLSGCLQQIFSADYNNMFIKLKVKTLLFDGFQFANKDDAGVACSIVRKSVIDKTKSLKFVEKVYDADGTTISSLRFSYFNYKKKTNDGLFTVKRGMQNVNQLGTIVSWNKQNQLPYWGRIQSMNNDSCSRVRGTDSTIYPPYSDETTSFDQFSTDICRIVTIGFGGEREYKGLTGYQYQSNEKTFWSETPSPENDCYCTQKSEDASGNSSCFLDGVINIMPCTDVPVLISLPHFLHADEKYINGVEGVDAPDFERHKMFVNIEPRTGTPLEGGKRAQVNMVLRPSKYLSVTKNLTGVVLPVLWLDEGLELPQEYVDELDTRLFNKIKILDSILYGLLAVVLAILLVTLGVLVRKKIF